MTFNENDSPEERKAAIERARYNTDMLRYTTQGFALATAVLAFTLTGIKLLKELK